MEISPMKKIFYAIIFVAAALLTACQEPEALVPSEARHGINSITASFPDDLSEENEFPSEIDYDAGKVQGRKLELGYLAEIALPDFRDYVIGLLLLFLVGDGDVVVVPRKVHE